MRAQVAESAPVSEVPEVRADWRFDSTGLSAGVTERLAEFDNQDADQLREAELPHGSFPKLFQVPGPRDTTLFAFLRKRYIGDAGCFFVFLEDTATGAITADPIRYCSTWSSHQDPKLHLIDLNGDGVQEVVTMDFVHNGTVLNLTVDSYWEVAADSER